MASSDKPFDFSEFQKMFEAYPLPGVDWQKVVDSQQKNIAALTKANQVWIEGAKTVMQRQSQILEEAMAEMVEASKALMDGDDPKAGTNKRFELAKTSVETAVNNMRELAELAGQSNREAVEVINQRTAEGLEEIKKAMQHKS